MNNQELIAFVAGTNNKFCIRVTIFFMNIYERSS